MEAKYVQTERTSKTTIQGFCSLLTSYFLNHLRKQYHTPLFFLRLLSLLIIYIVILLTSELDNRNVGKTEFCFFWSSHGAEIKSRLCASRKVSMLISSSCSLNVKCLWARYRAPNCPSYSHSFSKYNFHLMLLLVLICTLYATGSVPQPN